jgi:hypothetical protein
MMILPLYAFAVWYMCFRLRRTWLGWFALFAADSIVVAGVFMYPAIERWISGESTQWSSFQFVMWAEALMVAIVGAFVLMLPREFVRLPCRKCGYELESLAAEHETQNPQCPECGLEHAARKPGTPMRNETLAPLRTAAEIAEQTKREADAHAAKVKARKVKVPQSTASANLASQVDTQPLPAPRDTLMLDRAQT